MPLRRLTRSAQVLLRTLLCTRPRFPPRSTSFHVKQRAARAERGRLALRCVQCGTGRHLARVALPYVFRHLVTELAAMNIRCALAVR